jgi:hypothetical protein
MRKLSRNSGEGNGFQRSRQLALDRRACRVPFAPPLRRDRNSGKLSHLETVLDRTASVVKATQEDPLHGRINTA